MLPAEIVEGERYHIEAEVENDGYMNRYRIASDFGRFEAYGTAELAVLLQEIGALVELDELSKTKVFADAIKEGATRSVRVVQSIAERPLETVKGVPTGVKKLFGRSKRAVESGYETAKDVVSREGESSKGEAGESKDEETEGVEETSRTAKAKEFTSDIASDYLGVNAAQRRWAQKLGVDPYTTNEVLKKAIKEVAKVDTAGRFAVRMAPIPKIPGAGTIAKVNSLVWTMDPYELMQFNKARLTEAGVEPEAIDRFYQNAFYSPSEQTVLITALLALEATANLGQALTQASSAESDSEALFFVAAARMLQWFQDNETPIVRLLPGLRALVGEAQDGRVVFHAPVDYLTWTPEVAEAAQRLSEVASSGDGGRELWLMGEISPRCREELESLGWTIRTGIGLKLYEATQSASE